ncbi:MAG TPA: NAD-dependent epimerase/dehydratase family protein, partial [Sorangium sp.]|nr:NAD-dependent epimerase/dehydratase family protein [Sorangium sp.]
MSKRIIVTGGAGFLGSHLCDRLLERGDHVVCVDDFSTGHRNNIAQHANNERFEVLDHDVAQPWSSDIDQIFHLACPASPMHYRSDPVRTIRTCVMGSMNVLDIAKATGARVLLASTSEVYGDPSVHPQVESYWGHVNPNGPRACYDEGKR